MREEWRGQGEEVPLVRKEVLAPSAIVEAPLPIEQLFNIYSVDYGYSVQDGEWHAGIATHCTADDENGEFTILPDSEWSRQMIVQNGKRYTRLALPLDNAHSIPADAYLESITFAMRRDGQGELPSRFRDALVRLMTTPRTGENES